MTLLNEREYQAYIIEYLIHQNGYIARKSSNFNPRFAIDQELLFKFLWDTQEESMQTLKQRYKTDFEDTIINFINTEITKSQGSLIDAFKNGIEIANTKIYLMYSKPATTFNKDLLNKYSQNIFSVMEEVWASDKERIDLVIFLNGFAIISFELKCNHSGQTYQENIRGVAERERERERERLFWNIKALDIKRPKTVRLKKSPNSSSPTEGQHCPLLSTSCTQQLSTTFQLLNFFHPGVLVNDRVYN